MERKFIQIGGSNLSYLEENAGRLETIFLLHGNSGSATYWRKQLGSDLLKKYRLVAFDLPAHGQSNLITDADGFCSLRGIAEIMAQAIQQLASGQKFIIAGISLATNIVAEMPDFDSPPRGFVLAGPCIVGGEITIQRIAKPDTHIGVLFTDEAPIEDVRSCAREISASDDSADLHAFVTDYTAVKKPLRSSLARTIADERYSDEIALLRQKNIPALVVFGREEQIIDTDYLDNAALPLWQEKVFKLPGAGHLVNIDQPEAFNELLATFAADVFRKRASVKYKPPVRPRFWCWFSAACFCGERSRFFR